MADKDKTPPQPKLRSIDDLRRLNRRATQEGMYAGLAGGAVMSELPCLPAKVSLAGQTGWAEQEWIGRDLPLCVRVGSSTDASGVYRNLLPAHTDNH